MKMRPLFAVIPLFLLSGSGLAQSAPFSETVEVTIVEVPVTVVDRNGKAVRNLTKEDFEVTDEGKRVELIGFEMIDLGQDAPADHATPAPPAAYRNFLLLFDLANSSPGTVARAQKAAREFVSAQLGPRDLAAVATVSVEHGLRIVTSFTSDRTALGHAVDTLGDSKFFKVADPLRLAPPPASSQQGGPGRRVEGGAEQATQELQEKYEASQRVNDQEQTTRLNKQLGQLANVARMLDTLRGQKQIILLSEGFDPKLVQGRQDLSARATQKDNDAVLSGEIWNVESDTRFGNATTSSAINQMAELFRRSDVILHAIDIKGLRSGVDASDGSKVSSNEGLHLITRPTGGTVFQNASSLSENFARLLKQQEVVYLLAFNSKGQKAGKFHSVKVKVPGSRGARVQHRSGYYEATGRTSALEQTLSLADIMMTDADVRQVPLALHSMPLPAKNGGARLPVIVEIPGAGLLDKVTGKTVTATLFVYAFDEEHQIRDYLQQQITFDLARSGDQLRSAGMRYVAMLQLPPAKYAVKALVRVDETGRVGFLRTDVVVPPGSGPAVLPPVFVVDRPGWINIAAPGTGSTAVAAFTAAGKAFIPTVGLSLKSDSAYRVALFVHDTPSEDLEISPVVVSSDGSSRSATVSLIGRTQPDAEGSAKVLLEFKPPQMVPGDYRLQFTVKPKDGRRSVVAVPFRMD